MWFSGQNKHLMSGRITIKGKINELFKNTQCDDHKMYFFKNTWNFLFVLTFHSRFISNASYLSDSQAVLLNCLSSKQFKLHHFLTVLTKHKNTNSYKKRTCFNTRLILITVTLWILLCCPLINLSSVWICSYMWILNLLLSQICLEVRELHTHENWKIDVGSNYVLYKTTAKVI